MKKALLLFFISTAAFGSGYEKAILWGGKYSGMGGAATAGIKGSDSIFYNPAGLVNSSLVGDLTVNVSNSSSQFKGSIVPNVNVLSAGAPPTSAVFTNAERKETSNQASTLVPGVTYSMKLNDNMSFGLGYYAVGGTRAVYENIDFAPRSFQAKVGSEITITEFAAGMGYKVSDALRLGLSLRYTMTNASFSSMGYTQAASGAFAGAVTAIQNIDVKDIKVANLDSVRLGAQYDLSESTKFGLMIRTETKLDGDAKASGRVNTCANASCSAVVDLAVPESTVKVSTVLPMAINLGVEHALDESWTLYGEYSLTKYSQIDKVGINGSITVGSTVAALPDIVQKWKDQNVVKLGAEYKGTSWPIRFGYIWTSQVADNDYARASFSPPGAAATYTLGTGQTFNIGQSPMDFNVALDYGTISGSASENGPQPLATPKGTYEANSTGIHTGFAYHF